MDMGISGEIQAQGDIVYVCAPLLAVDGLSPLVFHVGPLVQWLLIFLLSMDWAYNAKKQAGQDKGQWAQTEAEEVPAEHEEELLPSEGDGALEQAAQREVVESPSLEIFKTHLDKVLCSLL